MCQDGAPFDSFDGSFVVQNYPFFVEPNLNGRPSAISAEELGLESEFGAGMLFVGLR